MQWEEGEFIPVGFYPPHMDCESLAAKWKEENQEFFEELETCWDEQFRQARVERKDDGHVYVYFERINEGKIK